MIPRSNPNPMMSLVCEVTTDVRSLGSPGRIQIPQASSLDGDFFMENPMEKPTFSNG